MDFKDEGGYDGPSCSGASCTGIKLEADDDERRFSLSDGDDDSLPESPKRKRVNTAPSSMHNSVATAAGVSPEAAWTQDQGPTSSEPGPSTQEEGSGRTRNPWGNESYASLITAAINSAPGKRRSLNGIYEHMIKNIPFFNRNKDSKGWKNSIRHNLSLNRKFKKNPPDDPKVKASFWSVEEPQIPPKSKDPELRFRSGTDAAASGKKTKSPSNGMLVKKTKSRPAPKKSRSEPAMANIKWHNQNSPWNIGEEQPPFQHSNFNPSPFSVDQFAHPPIQAHTPIHFSPRNHPMSQQRSTQQPSPFDPLPPFLPPYIYQENQQPAVPVSPELDQLEPSIGNLFIPAEVGAAAAAADPNLMSPPSMSQLTIDEPCPGMCAPPPPPPASILPPPNSIFAQPIFISQQMNNNFYGDEFYGCGPYGYPYDDSLVANH